MLKRFGEAIHRRRGERGSVAVVFALTLPILIGGAGFGVETTYWYLKDLQLQAAADAAAYAGAIEKRSGSSDALVVDAATKVAISNGYNPTTGTIAVNTPPKTGPNQTSRAVEVAMTQPVSRFFTTIFSNAPVVSRARAVAIYQGTGNACVLALSPAGSRAVLFSGNTNVHFKGCDVMANSIADDAIRTQGSSVTSVGCFISGGNVDLAGGTQVTDCPKPVIHAPPIGDPFAAVPAPDTGGACKVAQGASLSPGHYCGGMNLKDAVDLAPGVYVVSGGDFKVNANATIHGDGVFVYLAGDSRVSMNGNATVNLSAPTSGTYAGMLFMGDRLNFANSLNTLNGTASSSLTGYLYFATQPVQYLGNFSGKQGCTRVVANTIEWSGNTTLDDSQDCSTYGLHKLPSVQLVKLAE
jgi:Flp pilus assembly protein TadG